ncbi:hypothetical protein QJS04_geneDACA024725 [Acorus gramineus]|uniref:Uncharacterized protein n=1 Tax=Acorus gramineus TaxID=55184 RepID=A0AAV9AVF8_ACOGR|nr:hypothetical protein QJS04_geneDACA024725 [Acorus gramineus]
MSTCHLLSVPSQHFDPPTRNPTNTSISCIKKKQKNRFRSHIVFKRKPKKRETKTRQFLRFRVLVRLCFRIPLDRLLLFFLGFLGVSDRAARLDRPLLPSILAWNLGIFVDYPQFAPLFGFLASKTCWGQRCSSIAATVRTTGSTRRSSSGGAITTTIRTNRRRPFRRAKTRSWTTRQPRWRR